MPTKGIQRSGISLPSYQELPLVYDKKCSGLNNRLAGSLVLAVHDLLAPLVCRQVPLFCRSTQVHASSPLQYS